MNLKDFTFYKGIRKKRSFFSGPATKKLSIFFSEFLFFVYFDLKVWHVKYLFTLPAHKISGRIWNSRAEQKPFSLRSLEKKLCPLLNRFIKRLINDVLNYRQNHVRQKLGFAVSLLSLGMGKGATYLISVFIYDKMKLIRILSNTLW